MSDSAGRWGRGDNAPGCLSWTQTTSLAGFDPHVHTPGASLTGLRRHGGSVVRAGGALLTLREWEPRGPWASTGAIPIIRGRPWCGMLRSSFAASPASVSRRMRQERTRRGWFDAGAGSNATKAWSPGWPASPAPWPEGRRVVPPARHRGAQTADPPTISLEHRFRSAANSSSVCRHELLRWMNSHVGMPVKQWIQRQ